MIEPKMIVFAEWATQGTDFKMIIANTFDSINGTITGNPPPGVEVPTQLNFAVPSLFLVFVLTASIADSTAHEGEIHILHEDGNLVVDPIKMPIVFVINPHGRPMRFQGIVNMSGLPLVAPADYVVKLLVDGREIAEAPLYVQLQRV